MNSIDISVHFEQIHSLRVTEANGAIFFWWVRVFSSRDTQAPHVLFWTHDILLNVRFWLMFYGTLNFNFSLESCASLKVSKRLYYACHGLFFSEEVNQVNVCTFDPKSKIFTNFFLIINRAYHNSDNCWEALSCVAIKVWYWLIYSKKDVEMFKKW